MILISAKVKYLFYSVISAEKHHISHLNVLLFRSCRERKEPYAGRADFDTFIISSATIEGMSTHISGGVSSSSVEQALFRLIVLIATHYGTAIAGLRMK